MVMSGWVSDPEPKRNLIQKRERWARSRFCSKVLTHSKHQLVDTRYKFLILKQWLIRPSISIGPHGFQQPATIAFWLQSPQLNRHIGARTTPGSVEHMCREITYHIAPFAKGRTGLPF